MTDLDAFQTEALLPEPLPESPFPLFLQWFHEARDQARVPNPNAMTLATVGPHGRPSARIVLCKDIDVARGSVTFFTNRLSRKGRDLAANPVAAVVFHWDHTERQVRIEGRVTQVSDEESDAYFATRRWESRIGAWASRQSEPVESRQQLFEAAAQQILDLNIDIAAAVRGDAVEIPRPPHWGGYRLHADRVELWHGSTGRLHDRAAWTRELPKESTGEPSPWRAVRLQP